jgi:zinc transport system substrate-binding protein
MPRLIPAAAIAALTATTLAAQAEVPTVVTDIAPVHALVAQVMGDLGAPVLLLDRGADPHSFQLRPSQAAALSAADIVFWVGPELTPWLDRALEGAESAGTAVSLLRVEGVTLRSYGDDHGHEEAAAHDDHGHDEAAAHDDHGHDHGHDHDEAHDDHAHDDHAGGHDHDHKHEGTDPHAWLDPANAQAWLTAIAARLAAADPANADTYAANAAAATQAVQALDAEIRAALAPAAGRPLFVFHDAYGYLAAAYGLTIAGTIADGDAADPGARRLADLRAALGEAQGACLFAEANHDPAYVEAIAGETGIRTATLDPSGSALDPGPELYATMMRALAAGIAGCAAEG